MSIDDDKKRENASVENSLMKKEKAKNELERGQKKKKKDQNSYAQRVKERIGE